MTRFTRTMALYGILTISAMANEERYFTTIIDEHSFSKQIDDLNDEQLDSAMLGKSFFTIPWVEAPSATTARDGLGPLFNANTCISCHPNNGVGDLFTKSGELSRSNILKLSIPNDGSKEHKKIYEKLGFIPDPTYGVQISINGVFGVAYEAKPQIKFEESLFKFPDGETITLQKPVVKLTNLQYGKPHKNMNISLRKAPALVGLGLLELVSDKSILANEDKDDKNNDGIKGEANIVYSPYEKRYRLGRYTYKASAPSIVHQVASAANSDMGLTSPIFPKENCTKVQKECNEAPKGKDEFDLPLHRVEAIAYYLKTLKAPLPKKTKEFENGKNIFNDIGCVKCHIDNFTTTNGIKISPYSDLLLHDMGDELADGRVEFNATSTKWRTAPLWGISAYEKTLKSKPRYLHDGRARTLEEAILWHGGEATKIKENFINLPKEKRESLINFLKGL